MEWLSNPNPALVAAIASVITVAITKMFEHFILGKKLRVDDAAAIRIELRNEINLLRQELRDLYKELDSWKGKYYELQQEYNTMKFKNDEMASHLKDARGETEVLRSEVKTLREQVKVLRTKVGNGDTQG